MLATDGSGASLTALNASELGSGTVPTARLGSGTASSSTILYGDQTYKAEPAGGATTMNGLTDVSMDITNFVDSFLIQTNSNGSAPTTGTLSSATANIGLGKNVFKALSSGDGNVCIGEEAGALISTGSRNVCLGADSGNSIADADYNIFLGPGCGTAVTSGGYNIAIGYQAYNQWDTETHNIAIGYDAMGSASGSGAEYCVAVGDTALNEITTGDQNTAVGNLSLSSMQSGERNTGIGANSGNGCVDNNNNSCIGYDAQPSASNVDDEFTLGDTSISTLRCADTTISSLSDERDKTDIIDSPYGLSFINSLRPVQFKWERRNLASGDDDCSHNGKTRIGFIAQELQKAMPDNENDILDLVYNSNPERLEAKQGKLVPILVKAVQELTARIKELEDR